MTWPVAGRVRLKVGCFWRESCAPSRSASSCRTHRLTRLYAPIPSQALFLSCSSAFTQLAVRRWSLHTCDQALPARWLHASENIMGLYRTWGVASFPSLVLCRTLGVIPQGSSASLSPTEIFLQLSCQLWQATHLILEILPAELDWLVLVTDNRCLTSTHLFSSVIY